MRTITFLPTLFLAVAACECDDLSSTDTDVGSTGNGSMGCACLVFTVKVNLRQGGFQIIDIDGTVLRDMPADDCQLEEGYHTCHFIDLKSGAYRVTFLDVAGYQTPPFVLVQFDGQNDEVVGDYTKL